MSLHSDAIPLEQASRLPATIIYLFAVAIMSNAPHKRNYRFLLVVVLFTQLAYMTKPADGLDELPDGLRSALVRQTQLMSTCTFRSKKFAELHLPARTLKALFGLSTTAIDEMQTVEHHTFHWDNGKVYSSELSFRSGESSEPYRVHEVAFDGEIYSTGSGVLQNRRMLEHSTLVKQPLSRLMNRDPRRRLWDAAWMEAAGFVTPATAKELSDSPQIEHALLRAIDKRFALIESVSKVDMDEYELLRVTIDDCGRITKFDFDPSLDYALRSKRVYSASDALVSSTTNDQFYNASHETRWLPTRSRVDYHEWLGARPDEIDTPVVTVQIDLVAFSQGHDDQYPTLLDYSSISGTRITDGTIAEARQIRDGEVSYIVPPTASHIDAAIASYVESQERDGVLSSSSSPVASWLILINVCVLVVGCFVLLRQLRTKGSQ